jgi:hypothetical protein
MTWTSTLVPALAQLYPYEVSASEELEDALSFIGSSLDPRTVVQAGYGGGFIALLLGVPLVLFSPLSLYLAGIIVVALSLGTVQLIHSGPKLAASLARTRALGDAPNLVGRAVLRMQIQPAIENAVRFAADTGDSPLSESLNSHIDANIGTPQTGVLAFADEWADDFPALRRSAALLVTAQDAPEGERQRTLERSLGAVLDGTRDKMADFTNSIQGPTTALYAFGVMLPLALVALFPAAGVAGFGTDISIWFFVAVYNILLPAGLVAASYWLLVRRPVAFPPPKVTRDHPDVPTGRLPSVLSGLGAFIGSFGVIFVFGPTALASVIAVGFGVGVFLIVYYRPIMKVRNYVKEVEEHLVDALYLTGRLVAEDNAVEAAIQQGADQIPGATGEVFGRASNLQRRVQVGVHEAFHGEFGALRDIPSTRADSTANLLAIASEEGQPAGRAILSMADHLEELQEVEKETKRALARVTDTLDNSAAFFGPLVAGATVGLAGGIADLGSDGSSSGGGNETAAGGPGGGSGTNSSADVPDLPFGGGGIDFSGGAVAVSPDLLGIVIGIYLILLCLILIPLSTSLRHGFDRALIGYGVGIALTAAMPIYALTIVVVNSLF